MTNKEKILNSQFRVGTYKNMRGWFGFKVWENVTPRMAFGYMHMSPSDWVIKPNSIIRDKKLDRDTDKQCGRGISIGTSEWMWTNAFSDENTYYLVFIPKRNIENIIVPNKFEGKIRTNKVYLVKKLH